MSKSVDVLRQYARNTGAFWVNNKGATELAAACAAAAELIDSMSKIQTAAKLGLLYHSTGPGYTEEIERIATDAIARVEGGAA